MALLAFFTVLGSALGYAFAIFLSIAREESGTELY